MKLLDGEEITLTLDVWGASILRLPCSLKLIIAQKNRSGADLMMMVIERFVVIALGINVETRGCLTVILCDSDEDIALSCSMDSLKGAIAL